MEPIAERGFQNKDVFYERALSIDRPVLYALFLKGQGHQGIFSLIKGIL